MAMTSWYPSGASTLYVGLLAEKPELTNPKYRPSAYHSVFLKAAIASASN